MKNKLDLEILDNSNDDTIEQLSEYDILTDSEKERMFRRSMEIRQDKNKNSEKEIITEKHTGTKEIIINAEHQKKRITNYIAAAAAVILMIGSLRMALNIRNNDDHDISEKAQTGTGTVTELTTTVPETIQTVSDTLNATVTDTIITTSSEKIPATVYTTNSVTELTTPQSDDSSTEEHIITENTTESSEIITSYTEAIMHETPVTSVPVSDTNIPEISDAEITAVPADNSSDDNYSVIVTADISGFNEIIKIDGTEYRTAGSASGYSDNEMLKISATETTAAPGEKIFVDFFFEDPVYLNAICLFLSYDNTALKLTDISLECTDEKNSNFISYVETNCIFYFDDFFEPLLFTKSDKIRLYFEVLNTAEEKEYRIDLTKEVTSGLTGVYRIFDKGEEKYIIYYPWKSKSAIINVKK